MARQNLSAAMTGRRPLTAGLVLAIIGALRDDFRAADLVALLRSPEG